MARGGSDARQITSRHPPGSPFGGGTMMATTSSPAAFTGRERQRAADARPRRRAPRSAHVSSHRSKCARTAIATRTHAEANITTRVKTKGPTRRVCTAVTCAARSERKARPKRRCDYEIPEHGNVMSPVREKRFDVEAIRDGVTWVRGVVSLHTDSLDC
jgi:hypothetical protein